MLRWKAALPIFLLVSAMLLCEWNILALRGHPAAARVSTPTQLAQVASTVAPTSVPATPTASATAPPTSSPTRTPTNSATPTATRIVLPSATPTLSRNLPVVTQFVAVFVPLQFSTFYTVTASDPDGDALRYAWSNSNPCGKFIWTENSRTAQWLHPDVPGSCPQEDVHPGTITVVVRDMRQAPGGATVSDGQVTCVYTRGSAPGQGAQCR